ncbi:ABC transporter substrate-binding protein [Fervidibacillus halotolerans]|uniref:Extracellular solute-binding protein n=1 Tax=Fervidibacillus halotolerans TaxID=2980027 RepID=A0A9E8LYS4_9BACI|nr:extracellular solute-binding protein [Fervidibacillus halotolerans]WAA12051.1 extracellular solute-binding protein [Fervidibacillus halotolerans]
MKKLIYVLLSLSLVFTLAACNSSDEDSGKSDDSKDQSITLAVWASSPAESNALEETVKSFEEKTGIDVEIEVIQDNFQDAITARFAAKNAPDVFYLEAYVAPKFINSGVLLDITDEVEDPDDFYQPLLNAFKDQDGNLYALPKDYSTLATYVNTDLLEKAGYTIEDVPSDWEGLVEFAKELQTKLEDGQAAMVFDGTMARHLSSFIASGLNPVKDDGKADFTSSQKALDYLQSIVVGQDGGYILSPQIDLGMDWSGAAFGANKAVIMIEGNWVLSALKQDYPDVQYKVLPAPTVNGKQQTMIFTVGYAISKNTKNKDAALQFVKYMTGEGQQQWSEGSGTLPTRISVAEKMNLTEDPNLKEHVEGAKYGTPWTSGITLPIISQSFDNQFQAALNGDLSVEDAMKAAEEEANAEIERQQE